MRYVKAGFLGLLVAVILGLATGMREYVKTAHGDEAESRARAYAQSIAVALNCAALFALLCVPVAVGVALARRTRIAPK
jgi:hypothetical protein